jgi:hypothetical protein
MKYTVVCAHAVSGIYSNGIALFPTVLHVEAANVQEAEYEAAAQHQSIVPPKELRFLAVFEGHLTDLKSAGLDSTR